MKTAIMWHDLSQPFYNGMPGLGSEHPDPEITPIITHERDGASIQNYSIPTHVGTHVDAPLHFFEDGKTIDDYPIGKFMGEGVILDVSQDSPEKITVDNIPAKDLVQPDDIVVFYTGWDEKYGTEEYDPHPWLATEVADWLIEQGVKMIGIDTITPDQPRAYRPEGWDEFPVHNTLLAEEILIAEHFANLEPLAGSRVQIHSQPIIISGGDGAPARVIAKQL